MSIVSKAIRLMFTENGKLRHNNLTIPDDIYRYEDIRYGNDSDYQKLDVYTPVDKKDEKLPTIISVHGGGFVYGTKEDYQYYCMNLAQKGFKVVNFSYRLAPENPFPAQMEDVNSVFKWVREHAEEYNLDLDNLFAVGDSAGGNLLGVYTGLLTKPSLNQRYNYNLELPDIDLKAIALNCGLYDYKKQNPLKDGTLSYHCVKELFNRKPTSHETEQINVLNFIHRDYPQTFIVTSEKDFLQDQPKHLMEIMTRKEVPFNFRYFSSKKDTLEHVFHLNLNLPEAKDCNLAEMNYFKEFIS